LQGKLPLKPNSLTLNYISQGSEATCLGCTIAVRSLMTRDHSTAYWPQSTMVKEFSKYTCVRISCSYEYLGQNIYGFTTFYRDTLYFSSRDTPPKADCESLDISAAAFHRSNVIPITSWYGINSTSAMEEIWSYTPNTPTMSRRTVK